MKKLILCLVCFFGLCFLGACVPETPLTDSELDACAEYAANLILKYDKNYSTLYMNSREYEKTLKRSEIDPETGELVISTPTPIVKRNTPTPTKAPTQAPGNTATPAPTEKPENTPTPTPSPSPIPTPTPSPYRSENDDAAVSEFFGLQDVTVSYVGFNTFKENTISGIFFGAPDKEKYLDLHFLLVPNDPSKLASVDLLSKELTYDVHINEGEQIFHACLTGLPTDMKYYVNDALEVDLTDVLFLIPENIQIDRIHFVITDRQGNSIYIAGDTSLLSQ